MDLIGTVGLAFLGGATVSLSGWLTNHIKDNDKADFDLIKFLSTAGTTALLGGLIAIPISLYAPVLSTEQLALITTLLALIIGKPVGAAYTMATTPRQLDLTNIK